MLTRDGKLVFAEGGARGASVLTANGVEFLDTTETPAPILRRSADEPWQPATGFLLPRSGVWRATSRPVAMSGPGVAMVLRTSDHLVPSWGGEILMRIDTFVPTKAFPEVATRPPRFLAVVIDGRSPNTTALAEVALDNLGHQDRVMIIDTTPVRIVLPALPGSHRTLLGAATERVVSRGWQSSASFVQSSGKPAPRGSRAPARDLAKALSLARAQLRQGAGAPQAHLERQILLLTDGADTSRVPSSVEREVESLRAADIRLITVGVQDQQDPLALQSLGDEVYAGGSFEDREEALAEAIPPPGEVVLKDVELTLSSAPAPLRVLEMSGGANALSPEVDRIFFGELYAGEARTEVARLVVPVWVPGEPLEIRVTATYRDVATGEQRTSHSTVHCRYSADVERIANARHGDVIAYASALAMVRRLHRAFLGSRVDQVGGLRPLVTWQANTLASLAKTQRDPAIGAQAEILRALLDSIEE
ncbi:vWA domain-containing protein [Chondromyces crocatus]|uniref:vWA domain-containing protein n=1 Tax=Chondromyces crocatus TaxID=52 RepID=UPI00067C30CB|nr:vWA domain-containing protein [Chondromyces crocatus]